MSPIAILMSSGIVLGLFLGVLLLTLDNVNRKANRCLGAIMIVCSLIVIGFGLTKFSLEDTFPHLLGIAPTLIFLLGPLFYFYAKILTNRDYTFTLKSYFHFLLFITLISFYLPFFMMGKEAKLAVYQTDIFSMLHRGFIFLQVLHAFIYGYFSRKIINNYYKRNKEKITHAQITNLDWIKTGINLVFFITGAAALFLLLLAAGVKIHSVYSAFIPAALSVTIISLAYSGLRKPVIFPIAENAPPAVKYERSTLTGMLASEYLERLEELMNNEKPYLETDLTLQKLSEKLVIPPYHLSQVLNEKLNRNFFDYINYYRVEEAKRLLSGNDGKLYTILAIAQRSGFNSKSAFNAAFKKHTSLTPTQFIKQQGKPVPQNITQN